MFKQIYSVFDKVALVYGNPFISVSKAVAVRDFANAAKDPNSAINRNPIDFSLVELGMFDDSSGLMTVHSQPMLVAQAIDFCREE